MKYLKMFEELSVSNTNLHKDDYVIIDSTNYWPKLDTDVIDFINNNIGQITHIVPYNTDSFYVKYENIPEKIKNRSFIKIGSMEDTKCFNIQFTKIIDFSKNKEDLEYISASNKYNL